MVNAFYDAEQNTIGTLNKNMSISYATKIFYNFLIVLFQ